MRLPVKSLKLAALILLGCITRSLTRADGDGIVHRSVKNQRYFRPYWTTSGDEWPSLFNPTMFD